MTRFHISIAVDDFDASVSDYSRRLGVSPGVVAPGRYALWRTPLLNFSISCKPDEMPGRVRHIGFEDDGAQGFSDETDCNGLVWEYFSQNAQRREIEDKFPTALFSGEA
jgi:hypothetical protein